MFAIGIRYLMGWAVATDIAKRNPPEEPEWPVHPGRVFMAMAAAHFETPWDDHHAGEQAALEWLESQASPEIVAPHGEPRSPVTCYVPVNDQQGVGALPSRRSKQARSFPRVVLEHDIVYLLWPQVVVPLVQRDPLDAICSKVTRLGHSSSLVQMWAEFNPDENQAGNEALNAVCDRQFVGEHWVQSSDHERVFRVAAPGTLANLRRWYNDAAVSEWADLQTRLASANGKEKKIVKTEIAERFGNRMPRSQRPILRATDGYVRKSQDVGPVSQSIFDDNLLVLTKIDGPNLPLESTVALMTALRGTILSQFRNEADTPSWISGHDTAGRPLQEPHLALVPLGFVGSEYADGHLLGAALVFPRSVSPHERADSLRSLFRTNADGAFELPILKLGRLGEWRLARETRSFPAQALKPETWTEPSRVWASVTPIVLDRFPKSDAGQDYRAWVAEVSGIIATSCGNIGLPAPIQIRIEKSSWHLGAPRAIPGKTGFPIFPSRDDKARRVQVHAWLKFSERVRGPVLVGAGRYMGYGLCKGLPDEDGVEPIGGKT